MKTFFTLACAGIIAAVSASASPCVNFSASLSAGGSYTDTTESCVIDGVTFSDFTVYAGAGFPASPAAASLTVTVVGDELLIGTDGLGPEHMLIYFQAVSGNVTSITLDGSAAESITETVCSGSFTPGTQTCSSPATVLNTSALSVSGNETATSTLTTAPIQYFSMNDSGGSSLQQSSITVSSVPEPMTLSMIGLGLLGLSAVGRKIRK